MQLLSAELASENPSSIGIEFDWRAIPPRITGVDAGGSAAKAGLRAGDLITAVDGVSVQGLNGFGVSMLIASVPAGTDVRLTVQRGAATKTFTARAVQD